MEYMSSVLGSDISRRSCSYTHTDKVTDASDQPTHATATASGDDNKSALGVNQIGEHTSCDVAPSSNRHICARSWRARAHTPGRAAGIVRTRPGCPTSLRWSRSSSNSSIASPRPGTAARPSSALHTPKQR